MTITTVLTNKLFRILALASLSAGLLYQFGPTHLLRGQRVEAVGNLDFTYLGIGLNDPVFTVTNMLPGDCQTRTIDAVNNGLTISKIAVKGIKTSEVGNLSTQLDIVIREGVTDLYGGTAVGGPKTVAQFFTDSGVTDQVKLSNLAPSVSTSYDFEVCFKTTAGNEYQNTSVVFDLKFGEILVPVELPEECDLLEGIVTEVINGSPDKDKIKGTGASEFIQGFGEKDTIEGGGGDDCIFGGDGDDKIESGTGRDIIVSGAGNDKTDGGTGEDIVYGNEGDDDLKGGSETDYVYGNQGNDKISGGSGIDYLYGGIGMDKIDGGSDTDYIYGQEDDDDLDGSDGADYVYGEAGNDKVGGGPLNDFLYGGIGNDSVKGDSGNDYLDGEADTDTLHGNSGTDTCVNGETLMSCEL